MKPMIKLKKERPNIELFYHVLSLDSVVVVSVLLVSGDPSSRVQSEDVDHAAVHGHDERHLAEWP